MSKLAWVALPLLIAAGWLLLLVLAKRAPSRQALNVWTSLLLLAYLLGTASLGIFWVANQQLPVFDWHYLFGYATVLLVAVHLTFNFRVVWRHLTRPRQPAPPPADPTRRRLGFAAALALLAGGPAFLLGLRHGRSELRIDWPAGAGDARTADPGALGLALVERFHAFSSHSRTALLLRAPGTEWDAAPDAFKDYPQAARVALPDPRMAPGAPLAALGVALWHCSGITDQRMALNLRASPSSGALFSTELYVAIASLEGVPRGLWHYDPRTHALEQVATSALELGAPAAVIATAVFRRTGRKYRDRTYRYVIADLGHALENLRVAASAVGWQAIPVAAFDESHMARSLGLDEAEEGVLALVPLHAGVARPPPPAPGWAQPLAAFADGTPRDVTSAIHLGSSLRAASAPGARPPEGVASWLRLRDVAPAPANNLQLIARRRSVRRFAAGPLPLASLAGVLRHMAQPPLLSRAVRIDLVANAVAGLAPGAYRYHPAQHALEPRRPGVALRAVAQAAALDQDVIGEAAVVFLLSIDRASFAADPLGPARGYRHAFLEAGMVGERVYLEAGARGLGACAVGAFYDDEAAALAGIDPQREWVVHFAALGIPA